ncbi:MAG: protein-export chaperone SecB [Janthinobacterium lividum]
MAQNNSQDQQPALPPLKILNQYIKDLSFENPNPEKSFQDSDEAPEMNLNLDIQAKNLEQDIFEITLHLTADAKRSDYSLFIVELQYTGIFQLNNVPQESVHPLLMIEGPRLLFPTVRHVVANTTREGGFPTLNLESIDFVDLYRRQYIEPQQDQTNAAKLDS